MGNASYRQTTGNQYISQDLRNYFQNDLPKFILQTKIGNGKFMKTYIMRVDSTPLVVKVYMKLSDEDLQVPIANLTIIWKTLSPTKYPNLLPYQMWMRSTSRMKGPASPVYLTRQFLSTNLYDRFSTRPFLNELEKLWILFQLFKCLEISHEHGVVHGDLKPENVMVTTSGWVVLTDFSPFKPARIPDDDPTDFQYYFDCMGRHRCYVAPERFYQNGASSTAAARAGAGAAGVGGIDRSSTSSSTGADTSSRLAGRPGLLSRQQSAALHSRAGAGAGASRVVLQVPLQPSMDVFSLGCVMAEVFLDGVPLLDLPDMLRYVRGVAAVSSASSNNSGGAGGAAASSDPPDRGGKPQGGNETEGHNSAAEGSGDATPPNGGRGNSPDSKVENTSTVGGSSGTNGGDVILSRLDQDEGSQTRSLLTRVRNTFVRSVIIDMTQRDHAQRLSVSDYLDILQGKTPHSSAGATGATAYSEVVSTLPTPVPAALPTTAGSQSALPPLPPLDLLRPDVADEAAVPAVPCSNIGTTITATTAPFPPYFASSLYPLFLKLHWTGVTPDDRVNLICQNYGELMRNITGRADARGVEFFTTACTTYGAPLHSAAFPPSSSSSTSSASIAAATQREALTVMHADPTVPGSSSCPFNKSGNRKLTPGGAKPGCAALSVGLYCDRATSGNAVNRAVSSAAEIARLEQEQGAGAGGVPAALRSAAVHKARLRKVRVGLEGWRPSTTEGLQSGAEWVSYEKPLLGQQLRTPVASDASTSASSSSSVPADPADPADPTGPTGSGIEGRAGVAALPSKGQDRGGGDGDALLAMAEKLLEDAKQALQASTVELGSQVLGGKERAADDAQVQVLAARAEKLMLDTAAADTALTPETAGPQQQQGRGCFEEESILSCPPSSGSRGLLCPNPADYTDSATTTSATAEQQGSMGSSDFNIEREVHDGLVILVNVLTSNYRHLKYPHTKTVALLLLGRIGLRCADAVILQHIVPLLVLGLEDPSAAVRACSVRVLRAVLAVVRSCSSVEQNLFPMFLSPALTRLSKDPDGMVRVALAEALGSLAETAKRFLDIAHLAAMQKALGAGAATDPFSPPQTVQRGDALSGSFSMVNPQSSVASAGGSGGCDSPTPLSTLSAATSSRSLLHPGQLQVQVQFPYEKKLEALREQVSRWIRELMTDAPLPSSNAGGGAGGGSGGAGGTGAGGTGASGTGGMSSSTTSGSVIKRVILMDITRLCRFFGQEATLDRLLTQLLTFLNAQDWELRHAFCAKIPAVCAFLGPTVTSECILPCVENALYDVEEKVVLCAVHALCRLVRLRLLSSFFVVDFAQKMMPLLLHPSESLRDAAVGFIAASAQQLGAVDAAVFLLPEIRPALRYDLSGLVLSAPLLRHALTAPLSRDAFRTALQQRLREMQSLRNRRVESSTDPSQAAAGGGGDSARSVLEKHRSAGDMPSVGGSREGGDAGGAFLHKVIVPDSSGGAGGKVGSGGLDHTTSEAKRMKAALEAEAALLEVVGPYLDLAAREINTKSMQWRNGLASMYQAAGSVLVSGGTGAGLLAAATDVGLQSRAQLARSTGFIMPLDALRGGGGDSGGSGAATGGRTLMSSKELVAQRAPLHSLLDWSSQPVPEHSVQALLVPHQKFGVPLFRALPEDVRHQALCLDGDGARNHAKLRGLFGLSLRQGEAARALAAGMGEHWDPAAPSGVAAPFSSSSSSWAATSGLNSAGLLPSPAVAAQATLAHSGVLIEGGSTGGSGSGNGSGGYTGVIAAGASDMGTVMMLKTVSPVYAESLSLLRRIKALDIPPLPPDMGSLVQPWDHRPYSAYSEGLDTSGCADAATRASWRPKEGVLLTTLREHTDAVNRLVVAPDQSYLASASADGTVKIWQTRYLDRTAFPRSAVTYRKHRSAVLDIAAIENSHSLASVSTDGSVHVWRVDMVSTGAYGAAGGGFASTSGAGGGGGDYGINDAGGADSIAGTTATAGANAGATSAATSSSSTLGVTGSTILRVLDPSEGAALTVQHFNSSTCSIVTYATERGGMHGWDLRASREVIHLPLRPELGTATAMTMSPDRNWVCLGTSRGFVSLWDIRYPVACKLWKHSTGGPIHRLGCCRSLRGGSGGSGGAATGAGLQSVGGGFLPPTDGAYLFVAAGRNEAAVWGIPEGGECCKCFRTVSLEASRGPAAPLPMLLEVGLPRHPFAPIRGILSGGAVVAPYSHHPQQQPWQQHDSVRAIIGRISQSNLSYLVTSGTDRSIRFWDFSTASKCYTVSGLEAAQPKGIFDAPKLNDGSTGKLFVCYVSAAPSADKILQAHLPIREGRGIAMPSTNVKDAVLDLKNLELPLRLLVSASRDGDVKLWR